jgi:hypothetical protein
MRYILILLFATVGCFTNAYSQVKYHPYYLGFTPDDKKVVIMGTIGQGDVMIESYDIKSKTKVSQSRISSFYYGIAYILPQHVYLSNTHVVVKNPKFGTTPGYLVFDMASGEEIKDESQVKQIADQTVALRKQHPTSGSSAGIYQPHIVLNDGNYVAIDETNTAALVTRIDIYDFKGKKTASKVVPVPKGEVFGISSDATMYAIVKPGVIQVFRFGTTDEEVATIPIEHQHLSNGIVGLISTKTAKGRDLEKLFYLSKSSFNSIRTETKDPKAPFPGLTCYTCNEKILGAKYAWVCQSKSYEWAYIGVLREGKNDIRESLDAAKNSARELTPLLGGFWSVSTSNEKYSTAVAVHNDLMHDGLNHYYPFVRFTSLRTNSDANNNYSTNVFFFIYPEKD